MTSPAPDSPTPDSLNADQGVSRFRTKPIVTIPAGIAAGFLFAALWSGLAFFGVVTAWLVAGSVVGILFFTIVGYSYGRRWVAPAFSSALGTAPYVLLLELDQSPAWRLLVAILLIGPPPLGILLGSIIGSRRAA